MLRRLLLTCVCVYVTCVRHDAAFAAPTYASFKLRSAFTADPSLQSPASLGDLNHDGHPDIGAAYWLENISPLTNRGAFNVFSSPTATAAWTMQGAHSNDRLGYTFVAMGDVDGDGTPDFAVSLVRETTSCYITPPTPASDFTGEVDVISGATHSILWSVSGNTNGDFGDGIVAINDIDGDGVKELVVTSSYDQNGSDHCHISFGNVFVFSGKTGTKLSGYTVAIWPGTATFITNVGDVDHDGYDDWAIDNEHSIPETVQVYSGKTGNTLLGSITLPSSTYSIVGIGAVGDVSGDSHADIAIAMKDTYTSQVVIYSGTTLSAIRTIAVPNVTSVAGLGDVDGDGVGDYGVLSNGSGGTGTGYVQLFSGATGAQIYKSFFKGLLGLGRLVPLGLVDGDSIPDFGIAWSYDYAATITPYNVYVFLSGTPNPHDPLIEGKDSFYPIGGAFYNF